MDKLICCNNCVHHRNEFTWGWDWCNELLFKTGKVNDSYNCVCDLFERNKKAISDDKLTEIEKANFRII